MSDYLHRPSSQGPSAPSFLCYLYSECSSSQRPALSCFSPTASAARPATVLVALTPTKEVCECCWDPGLGCESGAQSGLPGSWLISAGRRSTQFLAVSPFFPSSPPTCPSSLTVALHPSFFLTSMETTEFIGLLF